MVIARVSLVAHLAHLAGAGLAAVAPVHEEAHPQRARRGDAGTLAGPLAVLRAVVRLWRRGRDGRDGGGGGHGSGILGEGLERGKKREALVREDVFPGECRSLITTALHNNISKWLPGRYSQCFLRLFIPVLCFCDSTQQQGSDN